MPLTETKEGKHAKLGGLDKEKKEKEDVIYAELDLKESGRKLPPKKILSEEKTEYVEILEPSHRSNRTLN